MTAIRRRLASCALFLIALQLGVLFSVPVRACCSKAGVVSPDPLAAHPCCVRQADAHPSGCPMHGSHTPAHECRLTCDAQPSPYYLLGAVGVLPAPVPAIAAPAVAVYRLLPVRSADALRALPDPPPPRFV